MNILEFFRGTDEEIFARKEAKELRGRTRLTPLGRERLAEKERIAKGPVQRRWTTTAIVVGILFLAGSSMLLSAESSVAPNNDYIDPQTYARYLNDEIQRLGIKADPEEEALWANTDITPYSDADLEKGGIPVQQLQKEVQPRIDHVVDKMMPRSHNPLIHRTSDNIHKLRDETNELIMETRMGNLGQPTVEYTMAV